MQRNFRQYHAKIFIKVIAVSKINVILARVNRICLQDELVEIVFTCDVELVNFKAQTFV